jgi:cyclopropane fatty-acyl-phospholipid synthase-like methyltransferase
MSSMTARSLYEMVATRGFTARGLYLNLGYWRDATDIDAACEALVTLVAERARMRPGDDVLDVGFGFADQDILWMDRFAPARITGLNVTPAQVRFARMRVARLGLSDRIDLREGSATAIDLPDASRDIVTAVECAFHFETRERFFAEAFRVLRPGGRLVLADVIRAAPAARAPRRLAQELTWGAFARLLAIPPGNADRIAGYRHKLAEAGFSGVDVTSIREDVFPGWHRALGQDAALRHRVSRAALVPYRFFLNFDAETLYGAFDYVLAVAHKPA